MPLIAVTGAIAAGKSAFTQALLAAAGGEAIDTDRIARDLLQNDQETRREVEVAFGAQAFDRTGAIDRRALREMVFADVDGRRKLEGILHPRIRSAWQEWSRLRSPAAISLVEIPLLYETGAQELFDCCIVLGCSRETQLRRLIEGRRLAREVAEQIIASQWPIAQKIKFGDAVIWNDGSLAAFQAQTALCAQQLMLL